MVFFYANVKGKKKNAKNIRSNNNALSESPIEQKDKFQKKKTLFMKLPILPLSVLTVLILVTYTGSVSFKNPHKKEIIKNLSVFISEKTGLKQDNCTNKKVPCDFYSGLLQLKFLKEYKSQKQEDTVVNARLYFFPGSYDTSLLRRSVSILGCMFKECNIELLHFSEYSKYSKLVEKHVLFTSKTNGKWSFFVFTENYFPIGHVGMKSEPSLSLLFEGIKIEGFNKNKTLFGVEDVCKSERGRSKCPNRLSIKFNDVKMSEMKGGLFEILLDIGNGGILSLFSIRSLIIENSLFWSNRNLFSLHLRRLDVLTVRILNSQFINNECFIFSIHTDALSLLEIINSKFLNNFEEECIQDVSVLVRYDNRAFFMDVSSDILVNIKVEDSEFSYNKGGIFLLSEYMYSHDETHCLSKNKDDLTKPSVRFEAKNSFFIGNEQKRIVNSKVKNQYDGGTNLYVNANFCEDVDVLIILDNVTMEENSSNGTVLSDNKGEFSSTGGAGLKIQNNVLSRACYKVVIKNSSMIGNSGWDGGFGHVSSVQTDMKIEILLLDSYFESNYARNDGGVFSLFFAFTNSFNMLIDGCIFNNSRSERNGGAISYRNGKLKNLLSFSNDIVAKNSRFLNGFAENGAVMDVSHVTLSIYGDSFVSGNKVNLNGGAFRTENTDVFIVGNVKGTSNVAQVGGFLHQSGGSFLIKSGNFNESKSAEFSYNEAVVGGAFWFEYTEIMQCKADVHHNEAEYGGGIAWNNVNIVVNATELFLVHYNNASVGGGLFDSSLKCPYSNMSFPTILNNTSSYGSDIEGYPVSFSIPSDHNNRCLFNFNSEITCKLKILRKDSFRNDANYVIHSPIHNQMFLVSFYANNPMGERIFIGNTSVYPRNDGRLHPFVRNLHIGKELHNVESIEAFVIYEGEEKNVELKLTKEPYGKFWGAFFTILMLVVCFVATLLMIITFVFQSFIVCVVCKLCKQGNDDKKNENNVKESPTYKIIDFCLTSFSLIFWLVQVSCQFLLRLDDSHLLPFGNFELTEEMIKIFSGIILFCLTSQFFFLLVSFFCKAWKHRRVCHHKKRCSGCKLSVEIISEVVGLFLRFLLLFGKGYFVLMYFSNNYELFEFSMFQVIIEGFDKGIEMSCHLLIDFSKIFIPIIAKRKKKKIKMENQNTMEFSRKHFNFSGNFF